MKSIEQLTDEELEDIIFDLQMEYKEYYDLVKMAYGDSTIPDEMQQVEQGILCYIQYYQDELGFRDLINRYDDM